MFFHQFKYRLKYFSHTPTVLFWAMIFPIMLGTLFQTTFGKSISKMETFTTLPVAVVVKEDSPANQKFLAMAEQLTYSDDIPMFDITKVTIEEANKLLTDKKVDGIITLANERQLIVGDSDIEQSILEQFMNQYLRNETYISDVNENHSDKMLQALTSISANINFVTSTSLNGKDYNFTIQYFYALIAMVCMFGGYLGLRNANDIQADQSAIAARRGVSASRKITLLLADSAAALTVHFGEIVIVFFYLRYVLGIEIGEQPLFFFITCFLGSLIGILLGQFIGILVKGSESLKEGISTSVSLVLSFFSGLMFANMKDIVEKNVPVLNRINPASLITDCFYSLTVFDDMSRFISSLVNLIIISAILMFCSILLLRRNRYESI